MAADETWFEIKIDRDLALLLQRIVNAHSRTGRVKQAELRARIQAAIPAPEPSQPQAR